MDRFVWLLGGLMLLVTAAVTWLSQPDYTAALRAAVAPGRLEVLPVLTLVGGTVGGYITFAGAHRLLDAGIGGEREVARLAQAAVLGIAVTGALRVLLFLAVLGVVGTGAALDPANPAASAFRHGAGEWGYRFFGIVLWSAAITSVVGCSYTSLSFARSLSPVLRDNPRASLGTFIGLSLAAYLYLGRPVRLLILAGALNGMILPLTLGVVLLASRRRDLMGEYRHPAASGSRQGWVAWIAASVAAIVALGELTKL